MRFVFDTSVLVDYLRDDELSVNSLIVAAQRGQIFVSSISILELHLPGERSREEVRCPACGETIQFSRYRLTNKSNQEIRQQINRIEKLCEEFKIKVVSCSPAAQKLARLILEKHRSPLGKNALTDSLIISTGYIRKAVLVSGDKRWSDVGEDLGIKVLSPIDLVKEF